MRTTDVMERLGVTYRQLDHWVRRDYIRVPTFGSGLHRNWDAKAVRAAAFACELSSLGCLAPGTKAGWLHDAFHLVRKNAGAGYVLVFRDGECLFTRTIWPLTESCVVVEVEAENYETDQAVA